ncbi:MAG: FecR domain-containing protein [Kiritimatiellae bacterium]|nr:FecR domain-containing protein [Kiritimatiellia bacterium]
MSCEADRERIRGLFLGELAEEQRAGVTQHVAVCPDCAAYHAQLERLFAALAGYRARVDAALRVPADLAASARRVLEAEQVSPRKRGVEPGLAPRRVRPEPGASRFRRRSYPVPARTWGWRITGLAAALLIGLGVFLRYHWARLEPLDRPVVVARLGQAQGAVVKDAAPESQTPLTPGALLRAGEQIVTIGGGSTAVVVFPGVMRVELSPDTRLTVGRIGRPAAELARRTAAVDSGTVRVHVSKTSADRPTTLLTPHAEVTVLGTRFTLAVAPAATRVEVEEGRVRVTNRRDGQWVALDAGYVAVVGATIAVAQQPIVAGRAAPAPDTVPGLALWLKADAISGLADGSPVPAWPDSSGNLRHAVHKARARQPVFRTGVLNGRPVLAFDGRDDSMQGFPPQGFHNCTLFVVFRPLELAQNQRIFAFSKEGDPDYLGPDGLAFTEKSVEYADLHIVRGFTAETRPDEEAGLNVYVTGVPPDDFMIAACTLNDGVAAFRRNGGAEFRDEYADRRPMQPTRYGLGSGFDPSGEHGANRMDLAEVLFYTRALSDAERQAVEQYLSRKYGIALNAPARSARLP